MGVNGIYGLSGSGLDIESMVKVGMMSKQNQYDKMYKANVKATWQKEAYTNVYNEMTSFNLTKLSDYKLSSTTNTMAAKSSNEGAVTATANGDAATMTHKVTVNNMSYSAYLMSDKDITMNNKEASSDSINLKDSLFRFKAGVTSDVQAGVSQADIDSKTTYTYFGTTFDTMTENKDEEGNITSYTLGRTDADGNEVTEEVSKYLSHHITTNEPALTDDEKKTIITGLTFEDRSGETWSDISYDASEKKYKLMNKVDGVEVSKLVDYDDFEVSSVSFADGRTVSGDDAKNAISFTIGSNGDNFSNASEKQTISYSYKDLLYGDKTFNDLASDIKNSGAGLQATYDANHKMFSLFNSKGGTDNTISFKIGSGEAGDMTARLLNNMHLAQSANGELKDETTFTAGETNITAGSNGSITVDGRTYTDITDNKISVSGVTYTLQAEGTSTVSISRDTSSIVDSMKKFVEDYNTMIDSLNEKYRETKYSDYDVLTKSQEDAMTKEQVEKWTEKAKSGILYRDSIIGKIIDNMRTALSTSVSGIDGKYTSASSLGITSSNSQGHIKLDEDVLKKALDDDSAAVYKVFSTLSSDDTYSENGIANRLSDVMYAGLKELKAEAGTSTEASDGSKIGNKILQWQTKMSDFKTLMSAYETKLYNKYDQMEVMLQKLMSQSSFIFGQNA